jgi:hypothetical protein
MHYEEFCELAALYVLDALPQSERNLVQEAIAQFPEWEAELAAMQVTAANLAYGAPEVPLADGLKQRLFEQIAARSDSDSGKQDLHHIAALIRQTVAVSWESYPIPGVMVGKVYVDADKREIACFLRCAAGVEFPNHKHASNEEIVVLTGDLIIDGKIYTSGDRVHSAIGTVHQPKTQNGCLVFLHTSLDVEAIDS